ncbi:sensor histidine kinase [Heliomicrobium undosum]|uniref:sensor histidine kinase n=1 Tax=Heliomicrobium undosum TaxID=121734 RepID=UPI001F3D2BC0|nr:sensor histidine kinase KdpD [Heliomicrobium undosum]
MLESINAGNRGKLTVFLGAAAGVGKTYAMLEAAQELLQDGIDVVIGWVETHGRKETEKLTEGIPAIPPNRLTYRGKIFQEMNIDALLARKPAVALVDELAHTNIPGSRHTRRYQDIEELLAAGIHVYTTVNIQHVESLNDYVAKITGIVVKETVPDGFLLKANQIQIIDIPPEQLLQRLKEGKVYIPSQAREAMSKFFRQGNISALREMALRFTAQKVERQLETYMQANAINGPWPAGERVLVCVGPSPFSAQLIRTACRIANGLQTDWIAVNVETPKRFPSSERERDSLSKNLRLAEELGAEIVTVYGQDVAEEVLDIARKRNITQIVIGKPLYPRFQEWMRGSVVDKIIRHSDGISIHVIPGQPQQRERWPKEAAQEQKIDFMAYLAVFSMVALLTWIASWVNPMEDLASVVTSFLLPVLFSAVRWGPGPAIFAACAGVLAFDFFFVPPVMSFTVTDIRYLVTFLIFLLVALLTSAMAGRLKAQAENARQKENQTAALYALSREISAISDLAAILDSLTRKLAETFGAQVVLFLPNASGKLELQSESPVGALAFLDDNERAVLLWGFEHMQIAGRGTDTLGGAKALYYPILSGGSGVGVIGLRLERPDRYFQPDQRRLLEAFVGLAAIAINRIQLEETAKEARVLAESERLHTVLFNSLSHDLRTPLASIIGAVSGLLEQESLFSPDDKKALLQTIQQGANRMNRLVNNLLDMAKLESGIFQKNVQWCDMEDLIGVVIPRMAEPFQGRTVKTDISPGLPLVRADFGLLQQVLVNLTDNAMKYSYKDTPIEITVGRQMDTIEVSVCNEGPAIPEQDVERIFDKFYRLSSPGQVSGTGLGLAICKGIVEAHGGKIWAKNRADGKVCVSFCLPLEEKVPVDVPKGAMEADDE